MTGFIASGGIAGQGLISRRQSALPDAVLSALGGVTIGSAARLLTGLANGQAIDSFTNTAASGITLTNTGTNRPIYTTGFINGLPVATFDASDDRFIVSALPFNTGNSPFTVYAAFRAGTSSSTRNLFRLGGASTRQGIGLNIPSGGSTLVRFEVTGDVLDVNCGASTNLTWMIIAMRYDNTNNTLYGNVYGTLNGSGSKVLAAAPNWSSVLTYKSLGQGTDNVAMLGGQVGDLWFYNQFHSNSNRDSAVSRLKTLYNLP